MKPIERDVILFADDYFFGLNDQQLEEKMDEYEERQGGLYRYACNSFENLEGGEMIDLMARVILVIDYCFSSYHVKLDKIEWETIQSFSNYQSKMMHEIYEKSNIETFNFNDFVNSMGSWGQDNLLAYMNAVIGARVDDNYDDDEGIDNESEFILTLSALGSLYQQELNKQINGVN